MISYEFILVLLQAQKENDDENGSQSELRIAWQYRKYIQQKIAADTSSPASGGQINQTAAGGVQQSGAAAAASRSNKAVEAGIGREWCHSYDLTKCMGEETVAKKGLVSVC
jgi:elongator complex protein 4